VNELNPTRYRLEEVEALVRKYLSSPEPPCCANCGDEVRFMMDYSARPSVSLKLHCTGCSAEGSWSSPDFGSEWKSLHLAYLLECVSTGKVPRCPVDDCRVNYAEFEGGLLEFRCPYCSRRGRILAEPTRSSAALNFAENESIVFLTV
jgi:hypothetical protein